MARVTTVAICRDNFLR